MPAEMYRIPASEVHKVGTVLIQDNKELRKAERDTSGVYSFTEAGAGVQPLVLIGGQNGVINFFAANPGKQIVSRIADLQEIYMSVKRYTPAQRYEALNPVGDGIVAVTQGAASFAPEKEGEEKVFGCTAETLRYIPLLV